MIDSTLAQLQHTSESLDLSLESVYSLLEATQNGDLDQLKQMQKQYILDSFKVNKFHKDYKAWEQKDKANFIDTEVTSYNQKLGGMSRINDEMESLEKEYERLSNTIKLPSFKFSLQTLQEYDLGSLLTNLNEAYPSKVDLNELFSLDSESALPTPQFEVLNQLFNIEYRIRMKKQIKYEVLLLVKQELTAKNQKWASRDSSLNNFLTRDLPGVFSEIDKIKTSEYEDLKYYDDSSDTDMQDFDQDVEDIEIEQNEQNEQKENEEQIEEAENEQTEEQTEGKTEEIAEEENEQENELHGEPDSAEQIEDQTPQNDDLALDELDPIDSGIDPMQLD